MVVATAEYHRHVKCFKPERFGDRKVSVIGCGSVGSNIVMMLAKHGVKNIEVFDRDTVAAHNIPGQYFRLKDIGKPKVLALQEQVREVTGTEITAIQDFVVGEGRLGDVVFLAVDSMEAVNDTDGIRDGRKEIWLKRIKRKMTTKLMIECRMSLYEGRIYCINPISSVHIEKYEKTLYSDKKAEESECGTSLSVGTTVNIVSSFAVQEFFKWFRREDEDAEVTLFNEIPIFVEGAGIFPLSW